MMIRSVGDLKAALKASGESPEQFARRTRISNMTIRRLLKKNDHELISEKNQELIHAGFFGPEEVVLSGYQMDRSHFLEKLEKDSEPQGELTETFRKTVLKRVTSVKFIPQFELIKNQISFFLSHFNDFEKGVKALVIGALIYFMNPADLIADAVMGIGFIDDLGVMNLVYHYIHKNRNTT